MTDLLNTPGAGDWVAEAVRRHSKGIFGKLVPAVIWSDKRGDDGDLLVSVDPARLVAGINNDPHIVLRGHDPGKPSGQVLECANFETEEGSKFIVAVLGYYAGGDVLEFQALGLDTAAVVSSPTSLPVLPANIWIQFSTDPREVDEAWLDQVTTHAPLRVERTELSHNDAHVTHELIRIGVLFLTLIWNPYTTAIASEAGKGTYAAINGWFRKMLEKLADLRNPIVDIQAHHGDCQISFVFRGKDVTQHYAAHDALPNAAAQAGKLVGRFIALEMPARQLIYEFDKDALRWFPSYAILKDSRIITDHGALIAIEQLPTGLSLGLSVGEALSPVVKSVSEDGDG
jgi:hypothetical protein